MWFAGLPSACVPLWQLAHPLVMPVWSKVAFLNEVVLLWQFSHGSDVTIWFAGLVTTPANWPPWQVEHPDVIPVWFMVQVVKVVVLSVSTDESVIQTVLKRGASAYIVKTINPVDLPSALRQAVDGTVFSAIGLPEAGDSAARAAGLTEREAAILSALARGLSNEAIGKELWIAEQTVKFHLTNIYRKLGVSNRTEAARLAYQHGLVESPIGDH